MAKANPFRFSTKYQDDESDLVVYPFRVYSACMGRWINRDPQGEGGGFNLYGFVGNSPLNYIDPFGLEGYSNGELLAEEGCGVNNTFTNSDTGQTTTGTGVLAEIGKEVAKEGASQIMGCAATKSIRPLAGIARKCGLFRRAAKTGGQGFSSFSSFKRALGPAGENAQWHHIVEQTPGNLERFGAQTIHNTENLVPVPTGIHRQISGFYLSKQPFTGGQTVRQWLSTQPLEAQQQFGRQVMEQFGAPLP